MTGFLEYAFIGIICVLFFFIFCDLLLRLDESPQGVGDREDHEAPPVSYRSFHNNGDTQ